MLPDEKPKSDFSFCHPNDQSKTLTPHAIFVKKKQTIGK